MLLRAQQAINNLDQFSNQLKIKDIILNLQVINFEKQKNEFSPQEIQAIENLRSALIETYYHLTKKLKDVFDKEIYDSAKTLYRMLLILAEAFPINETDPITLETISEDKKIYVLTGHQFNINSLIDYHNERYYRGTDLGEQEKSKWLLNPLTNLKLYPEDVAHIQSVADERNILLKYLKDEAFGLNEFQAEALVVLRPHGLTPLMLLQAWKEKPFYEQHKEALIYLIIKEHKQPEEVIREIVDLNQTELLGMMEGLSRDEVISLGENRIMALYNFKDKGLTAAHLSSWEGEDFTGYHHEALAHLIINIKLPPQSAIEEINNLTWFQAKGIAKGLTHSDVLDLNSNQIQALINLRDVKLRAIHLQSWLGDSFDDEHEAALSYLLRERKITPEAAITEINNLNAQQAKAIAQGLSRREILARYNAERSTLFNPKLNNHQLKALEQGLSEEEVLDLQDSQIDALLSLKKAGLTASHLKKWEGNTFHIAHYRALMYLILECNLSPEVAIDVINGLNIFQVEGITKGLSREEVLDLQDLQISALLSFKNAGLTASHLKKWQGGLFDHGHIDALDYLIHQRKMNPDAAVDVINQLDTLQAEGIANKLSRSDVIGLQPLQISALISLKDVGLKSKHLKEWQGGLFDHGHVKALKYLLRKSKLSPEEAIKSINGLASDKAERIMEGLAPREVLPKKKK